MTTKIQLPPGYSRKRVAGGRTGATRFALYRGSLQTYDNWIGDVVLFRPEMDYRAQSRFNLPGNMKSNPLGRDDVATSWETAVARVIELAEMNR